jgi:Zn-dependent protease with chaperone function/MFS family permease
MKKTISAVLSISLILLSPGLGGWAAAGQVASRAGGSTVVAPLTMPAMKIIAAPSALSFNNVLPGTSLGVSAMPSAAAADASANGAAISAAAASAQAQGASASVAAIPAAAIPAAAAAQAQPQAASAKALISETAQLSLSSEQTGKMSAGQARDAGSSIMDRVLGLKSRVFGAAASVEASASPKAAMASLTPAGSAAGKAGPAAQPQIPTPSGNGGSGNGPRRNKALGLAATLGRVVLAAALVVGLQAAGAALLPAIFGLTPVAAVWAVGSGMVLFPVAVYARYRLGLRDSPRLGKVKWIMDLALGAYVGALAIAVPSLGAALAMSGAGAGLATIAAAGATGSLLAFFGGGKVVDIVLTGGALVAIPAVVAVTAGAIGLGPLIGMLAVPAMTTIAFFLGQIINSAETGRPFGVPGSMRPLRFPSFQWIMIGVVFALTTGFGAVYSNWAFIAWNLFGNKGMPKWDKRLPAAKNLLNIVLNFNTLYLGVLAFSAFTGFASPLTFLVIAFAPERAASWTEHLLAKFLPASEAAPSTVEEPKQTLSEKIERKWPAFHHWAKTFTIIGTMAAMAFGMGFFVVGFGSLGTNLAIAAALTSIPLFISKWLIKKMMQLKPAQKATDPEFIEIMTEIRETINTQRAAKGKKPINMPELMVAPMDVPNAAATGLSPNKSLVFVTEGIKSMLLDPEELREGLIVLLSRANPNGDEFKVWRTALVGSIPGVTQRSTPAEIGQALKRADAIRLKALGRRALRGVLGHEFMHVMDRHMITGTIGGAISSGVAFASYGVMWAVGHAKVALTNLKNRALGRAPKTDEEEQAGAGQSAGADGKGAKPQMLEPLTTGVVLKSLPALIKVFAALWAPVILQITQMVGSRNNEAQADEDGALITQDPASLALALGLLTTWRPKPGFMFSGLRLPKLAALSHMMTVNPLQQLQTAGALPKQDASGPPITGADTFLQNLFLTHPETMGRVRTLKRMADALRQDEKPPLKDDPPPPDGGAPPQARLDPPAGSAPAQSRGVFFAAAGLVRGAWEITRVLPDPARNRAFWRYTWGQAIANIGVAFHYSSLAKMLDPKGEHPSRVTDNRAVSSGAQLSASILTGPLSDRVSPRTMLVATYLGRGLLYMSVPILFFHGWFVIGAFHAIIAAAAFLQSAGGTACSVALQRILGDDEAHYNRANAVHNAVVSATGVIGPLLAGVFIAALDARLGLFSGNALAYGVAGLMLALTGLLYLKLSLPRGPPAKEGEQTGPRGLGARVAELVAGFKLIFRSRFLRTWLMISTFTFLLADPMMFAALPLYLKSLGLTGGAQAAAFTWYLAASALGTGAASLFMARRRAPEPPAKEGEPTRLERQGWWTSRLHGLSWLLYAGVFFAPTLPISIAFMIAAMAAAAPGMAVWGSLVQKTIAEETPRDAGKVYASIFFWQMTASILGSVGFGLLLAAVSAGFALKLAGAVMLVIAFLDWLQPRLVLPRAGKKK